MTLAVRRSTDRMLAGVLLALSFALTPFASAALPCDRLLGQIRPWNENLPFSELEKALQTSSVVERISLHDYFRANGLEASGTTPAFLLTLEGGRRGVFKPAQDDLDLAQGEVIAYGVSRLLGMKNVPPTVIRKIGEETGSLQYFVNTESSTAASELLQGVSSDQRSDADLLHFLIGQWDRHSGNFLVDESRTLVVIDNGAMSSRVEWRIGEYPWMARGRRVQGGAVGGSFPFDAFTGVLENPTREEVRRVFGDTLRDYEIDSITGSKLRNRYPDRKVPYIIWDHRVWLERRTHLGPLSIATLSPALLENVTALTADRLRERFGTMISESKISEILRRASLVKEKFGR